MEEKKVKEKMSYDELENFAHQVSEQNRQMYQQIQSLNMTNVFKRLDYLFKVLENYTNFPSYFVDECSKEIINILTIKEDNETEA